MKRARRLTADQVEKLVTAYQDRATTYELAKRFGIHRETVGLIL